TTRSSLIAALLEGLRWEEFVAVYGLAILRWVRRWARPPLDAGQLAQDTLVRLWRYLPKFDPARGPFRGFLHACTRSAALDALRQAAPARIGLGHDAVQELLSRLEARPESEAPDADLEEQLDAAEPLGRAVQRVKGAVPPRNWQAFVLRGMQ